MTDKLQACLAKIPNITSLKPEQTQAVEALLAGKDVLAILATGFGKSLVYQVFSMAQTSANASVLAQHCGRAGKRNERPWYSIGSLET